MNMHIFSLIIILAFILLIGNLNAQNNPNDLHLSVHINATDHSDYCFILPKHKMDIGESENGGNDSVYSFCSKPKKNQKYLPKNVWYEGNPTIQIQKWKKSGNIRWIQITGCFNPYKFSNLNPNDDGGQYDSNGGYNSKGNPQGSSCFQFNSYVELVEPNAGRICLRCCNDESYCDLKHDQDGCTVAIPGNYSGCS